MTCLSAYDLDPSDPAIDRVERAFLGAVLREPRLRMAALDLAPGHFRSSYPGIVWDVFRTMKRPDMNLLLLELEARGLAAPPGSSGWGTAISSLFVPGLPFDEDIPEYVRAIRDAARRRRVESRQHRHPRDSA